MLYRPGRPSWPDALAPIMANGYIPFVCLTSHNGRSDLIGFWEWAPRDPLFFVT
jgi:hypothetical protein